MNLRCSKIIIYLVVFLVCFPFFSNGQEDASSSNFTFHSVGKKETVYSIAKEHGVTPEDIYRFNPNSKNNIKPGDVLQIPLPVNSFSEKKKDPKTIQAVILHKVRKNETLYFIAQKYNCSQEEILKLNPGLTGSLRKGTVLKVPNTYFQRQTVKLKESLGQFMDYRIVSGDNYFQLNKRFGVDKEELIRLNPSLKNGLNAGMVIKIPLKNAASQKEKNTDQQLTSEEKTVTTAPTDIEGKPFDANHIYNVAFYLPFCGNLNDSLNLSSKTSSYLEFYEGALLAVDKMIASGMKVKLYVYDTYQDPKVAGQLVKKPEFLSLDLIIGPVFPECQKVITELSAKNRIPMVSPLSADSRYVTTNPYYFQINPDKKVRLTGTADYIARELSNKNVIMLNRGDNNSDQKVLLDKLKGKMNARNFHSYNLWYDGVDGFERLLNPSDENYVVMTEDDEANISVAFNRLNIVSKKFKITLIGLQEYTRLQSINIEYLHNLKLHYLAPYHIDYNDPRVTDFIAKYRSDFSAEPTQFSFQGYDVTTNFLTELKLFGRKFTSRNPISGTDLLQSEYNFIKTSTFSGYLNHTVFVIEYTDNYEVRSLGKLFPLD